MCRAQYTNMVGVLGRFGKHGRTTLYIDDVKTFYLDEDIPRGFQRREAPVRQTESETPASGFERFAVYTRPYIDI